MDELVKVEADPPPLERTPSPPPGSQTRPIELSSSPTPPPPAPLPTPRRHPPWPSRKHRRKKAHPSSGTNSFAHSAVVEPNERTVRLRSGRDVTIQAHRDRDRIKGPATGKRGKRKGKKKGKKRSGNGVKAEPGVVKVKREPGVKVKREPGIKVKQEPR